MTLDPKIVLKNGDTLSVTVTYPDDAMNAPGTSTADYPTTPEAILRERVQTLRAEFGEAVAENRSRPSDDTHSRVVIAWTRFAAAFEEWRQLRATHRRRR